MVWTASQLVDDQAMLIVDETGDEKSSTDCVGASAQHSGALGGIGPCQVAVHLTYASIHGQGLIDRALYLPADEDAVCSPTSPTKRSSPPSRSSPPQCSSAPAPGHPGPMVRRR